MKRWEFGNLARIHRGIGQTHVANVPLQVSCTDVWQDATNGYYYVNCADTRLGTPYYGVRAITLMRPLPNSMGLLFFANGDPALPYFMTMG